MATLGKAGMSMAKYLQMQIDKHQSIA